MTYFYSTVVVHRRSDFIHFIYRFSYEADYFNKFFLYSDNGRNG